jgi:hypothetical protein
MKNTKPKLALIEEDGNAFAILGRAREVARKAGWDKTQIDKFMGEAASGDYDHLLQTCMKYFEVK